MTPLEIPFRTTFKHASADRAKTASVLVEAFSGDEGFVGHGEGCPREYVTGESIDSAINWFEYHRSGIVADIAGLESLKVWVDNHGPIIDQGPAAWCAVELALLDLLGKQAGQPMETLLSLPRLAPTYQYSAVLGDGTDEAFQYQVRKYVNAGFRDFKIKLSGMLERDQEKISCLGRTGLPLRIRADANNLWKASGEAIAHVERLGNPFWAIEEPLVPRDFDGLAVVGSALGIKIILDESLTRVQDLSHIYQTPGQWVLNLRISKLGGLIRSIRLIEGARALGVPVVIGAHVGETSILTRAGLALAAVAGDGQIAMEGAFGTHLLERDVCERPLMFGEAGLLCPQDWGFSEKAGCGLETQGMG
jgi:L-alanine-DL-glutamate epimerase-like enolase superfamily enzyme